MKLYRVEFSFEETFGSVVEWDTIDGLDIEAESAEKAAEEAACTDGLEDAIFRVYELIKNEFGDLEVEDLNGPEYFSFRDDQKREKPPVQAAFKEGEEVVASHSTKSR